MNKIIDVKYPERQTKTYRIIWENRWITAIEGLHKDQFVVFDLEDENFYNWTVPNEQFEMVFLIKYSDKQILKIRSLSPLVYTEQFTQLDLSDPAVVSEIDRRMQKLIDEAPEHLRMVGELIEAMRRGIIVVG